MYTALDTIRVAERLNLVQIATPPPSPQSSGMAETFVNTLRRDYVVGSDLSFAEMVLDQVPDWTADCDGIAPHSALGLRSPRQYRAEVLLVC